MLKVFLILSFFIQSALGSVILNEGGGSIFEFKRGDKEIIKEYLGHQKKFIKKLCTPGTEPEFWKMYRSFRGNGHFIPVTLDEKLDRGTITRFIPEISKKVNWLEEQIKFLENMKNLSTFHRDVKSLNAVLDDLLDYKRDFFEKSNEDEKRTARNSSKFLYIDFKNRFKDFLLKVPFLLSYRYPVDHLELRYSYDKVKHIKRAKEKTRANEIYFLRKIVQDGAQNRNHTRSDTFLRTALDTISILLEEKRDFISENLRYDIRWALGAIDRHIDNGVKKELMRMREWRDRTKRSLEFYKFLQNENFSKKSGEKNGEELLKVRLSARYFLKNWVLDKQKEIYDFWAGKSELMQSLYALETILFNEVGSIDGRDGLERRDVSQVVINRTFMEKYNIIPKSDPLYKKINGGEGRRPLSEKPWLNVLLKEGEFSFTYFFIHGNVRMFCPDMTRRGRSLRKENLKISLEMLRTPSWDFKGVRYFSRASMLGRIDMSSIWENYVAIRERPGLPFKKPKKLLKLYAAGDYDFLYDFKGQDRELYEVIKIKNTTVVRPKAQSRFFKYRNPHFFRYFRSKKL